MENLTEDGYDILDGCIDVDSMETKKRLIDLRQRWDALYQTTMEYEIKTEVGLKPLQEFQIACSEFENWLEAVEGNLAFLMVGVGTTQELTQQIEGCQVRDWSLFIPKRNVFLGKNVADTTVKSQKHFTQPQISIKK